MTIGLARVTVNAPARRVDVALPEQAPLVELLPEVLRHAGVGLADDGEQHGGWVLRRADGTVLATAQTLLAQGVRDGEVLHLVPARAEWPELEYDDVVEAIVDGARRRGGGWSSRATRAAALGGAAVPLAVGLLALLTGGPGQPAGALAATGVAVLLVLAGTVLSRAQGDGPAGATVGGYALPYAAVAGALAVSSGDPVGPLAPLRWIGAAELLAGSAALLLVSVLGLLGVATRLRIFVAGAVTGAVGVPAALGGVLLGSAGAAAVLLCVLPFAIGAIPLLAIRLGKVPLPPITLPTGAAEDPDRARDLPDRGRVYAAVARTEEMLTGMLIAHAVLTVAAAVVLGVTGGNTGRVLVAVASAVLLLRARLFAAVRHRSPLVLAGSAGYAVLGAVLATGAGPTGRLVLAVGGVLVALVVVAGGSTYARRPVSPYLGRFADLTDTVLVVSLVPIACAVLGLYERARGLLG
ncbi:type VII secretion integral membrane protein EccD [Micromonospora endophytica]|uniref:Type VII secretion integral membrane protein EccD n=1 Tax=Micromonospora endophytica TaxID=515350 RepID=A0A2W2CKM1_9ACTN|nr:type VII secretion integral membrane protein EccD [Micromonospora endophytica]PZF99975.1 type VII secretion integral membrane protein EccD [Micromonospora endophytica]RIW46642.1 type VII secretion integral membrane protein EccD [Micromonospora endophytica]BCJ59817.1 type VII secretion integral membrane protein EccD [Micromonospora endophytica]